MASLDKDVPLEDTAQALDRGISEVASPSGGRALLVPALGGVVLVGVLIALNVSGSEESATDEPLAVASLSLAQAPRVDPFPDDIPADTATELDDRTSALAYDLQRQALAEAEARRKRALERQRSPMVLFDESNGARVIDSSGHSGAGGTSISSAPLTRDARELSREERFLSDERSRGADERFASEGPARATRIESPRTVVPQGTLIQGVLETAIQSDLPGMIRAQVSQDVPSLTGVTVIPRGSRLIGRYQSGLARGQSRVLVVWTRCIRPDGVSIELGSPGTDSLGRAGVTGEVDTHFGEIFGAALLLSTLDGAIDIASARAQDSDGSTIVSSGGRDLSRAADTALRDRVRIPPTVNVAAGTVIQVFVARDLDLSVAAPEVR